MHALIDSFQRLALITTSAWIASHTLTRSTHGRSGVVSTFMGNATMMNVHGNIEMILFHRVRGLLMPSYVHILIILNVIRTQRRRFLLIWLLMVLRLELDI